MSEETSESKDLVVKSFSDLSIEKYESYGDKSLVQNLQNAELAINKVKYTERIWDRSRSQFMLKHLTCSQADNWTRLRQVSAEMANKRMALNEAKFGYMESQVKIKMKRKKFEEETLSIFSNNQPEFSGRGVNIEITKKERGGGGGRRGRKPFGKKDGGGFGKRRSSEGSSGGRRSEGSIRGRSSSRSGGDRPDRNSSSDRKPSGFGRKRRDR